MKYICIDNVFDSIPLTFTAVNNFLSNVDSDEIALEHNQLLTNPDGPDWNVSWREPYFIEYVKRILVRLLTA